MMVLFGIFAWMMAGASVVLAEDAASSASVDSASTVASTADTVAPTPEVTPDASSTEETAPVAPAPVAITPPALKPITITFSGEVVSADAAGSQVTIQDRYGVKKEIAVPAEAKISQGTAAKSLGDLKAGDKVTVEYTYDVASNKRTAQSISLGEAAS
jgi:hypothetical protein